MSKGQTPELIIGIIIVFVIALLILISSTVAAILKPTILTSALNNSITVQTLDNVESGYQFYDLFPIMFVIISLGLGGALLASSIRTNPGFAIVGILGIMLIMLIAPQLSNAWLQITGTTGLQVTTLPLTNLLLTNFPTVIFLVGVVIMLALFIKSRGQGL